MTMFSPNSKSILLRGQTKVLVNTQGQNPYSIDVGEILIKLDGFRLCVNMVIDVITE